MHVSTCVPRAVPHTDSMMGHTGCNAYAMRVHANRMCNARGGWCTDMCGDGGQALHATRYLVSSAGCGVRGAGRVARGAWRGVRGAWCSTRSGVWCQKIQHPSTQRNGCISAQFVSLISSRDACGAAGKG